MGDPPGNDEYLGQSSVVSHASIVIRRLMRNLFRLTARTLSDASAAVALKNLENPDSTRYIPLLSLLAAAAYSGYYLFRYFSSPPRSLTLPVEHALEQCIALDAEVSYTIHSHAAAAPVMILTGPSHIGKSALARALHHCYAPLLEFVPTVTTALPTTKDPYHIHVSSRRFLALARAGYLVEITTHAGAHYGVPIALIRAARTRGAVPLLCLNIAGASTLDAHPSLHTVCAVVGSPATPEIEHPAAAAGWAALRTVLADSAAVAASLVIVLERAIGDRLPQLLVAACTAVGNRADGGDMDDYVNGYVALTSLSARAVAHARETAALRPLHVWNAQSTEEAGGGTDVATATVARTLVWNQDTADTCRDGVCLEDVDTVAAASTSTTRALAAILRTSASKGTHRDMGVGTVMPWEALLLREHPHDAMALWVSLCALSLLASRIRTRTNAVTGNKARERMGMGAGTVIDVTSTLPRVCGPYGQPSMPVRAFQAEGGECEYRYEYMYDPSAARGVRNMKDNTTTMPTTTLMRARSVYEEEEEIDALDVTVACTGLDQSVEECVPNACPTALSRCSSHHTAYTACTNTSDVTACTPMLAPAPAPALALSVDANPTRLSPSSPLSRFSSPALTARPALSSTSPHSPPTPHTPHSPLAPSSPQPLAPSSPHTLTPSWPHPRTPLSTRTDLSLSDHTVFLSPRALRDDAFAPTHTHKRGQDPTHEPEYVGLRSIIPGSVSATPPAGTHTHTGTTTALPTTAPTYPLPHQHPAEAALLAVVPAFPHVLAAFARYISALHATHAHARAHAVATERASTGYLAHADTALTLPPGAVAVRVPTPHTVPASPHAVAASLSCAPLPAPLHALSLATLTHAAVDVFYQACNAIRRPCARSATVADTALTHAVMETATTLACAPSAAALLSALPVHARATASLADTVQPQLPATEPVDSVDAAALSATHAWIVRHCPWLGDALALAQMGKRITHVSAAPIVPTLAMSTPHTTQPTHTQIPRHAHTPADAHSQSKALPSTTSVSSTPPTLSAPRPTLPSRTRTTFTRALAALGLSRAPSSSVSAALAHIPTVPADAGVSLPPIASHTALKGSIPSSASVAAVSARADTAELLYTLLAARPEPLSVATHSHAHLVAAATRDDPLLVPQHPAFLSSRLADSAALHACSVAARTDDAAAAAVMQRRARARDGERRQRDRERVALAMANASNIPSARVAATSPTRAAPASADAVPASPTATAATTVHGYSHAPGRVPHVHPLSLLRAPPATPLSLRARQRHSLPYALTPAHTRPSTPATSRAPSRTPSQTPSRTPSLSALASGTRPTDPSHPHTPTPISPVHITNTSSNNTADTTRASAIQPPSSPAFLAPIPSAHTSHLTLPTQPSTPLPPSPLSPASSSPLTPSSPPHARPSSPHTPSLRAHTYTHTHTRTHATPLASPLATRPASSAHFAEPPTPSVRNWRRPPLPARPTTPVTSFTTPTPRAPPLEPPTLMPHASVHAHARARTSLSALSTLTSTSSPSSLSQTPHILHTPYTTYATPAPRNTHTTHTPRNTSYATRPTAPAELGGTPPGHSRGHNLTSTSTDAYIDIAAAPVVKPAPELGVGMTVAISPASSGGGGITGTRAAGTGTEVIFVSSTSTTASRN